MIDGLYERKPIFVVDVYVPYQDSIRFGFFHNSEEAIDAVEHNLYKVEGSEKYEYAKISRIYPGLLDSLKEPVEDNYNPIYYRRSNEKETYKRIKTYFRYYMSTDKIQKINQADIK